MEPIEPGRLQAHETLVTYAKDQPEYTPLPAARDDAPGTVGQVRTWWIPTVTEIEQLREGAAIELRVLTFGRPLQPLALEVVERD